MKKPEKGCHTAIKEAFRFKCKNCPTQSFCVHIRRNRAIVEYEEYLPDSIEMRYILCDRNALGIPLYEQGVEAIIKKYAERIGRNENILHSKKEKR